MRNERISDVVKRAGGILESAYIKGAYLQRDRTEDEIMANQETLRLARANQEGEDSIALQKLEISRRYTVGIDLQKAIDNPGSTYDFVLQPHDHIFIPELQSTVKISGDVMYPNTVIYMPGKKLNYYVDQAGGFGEKARKNKAYIVYMNGTIAKINRKTPIEPGSNIIIPSKPDNPFDWNKVIAVATSLGSLATLAAAIVTLSK